MPGLVPGIHVFANFNRDVDGRDKPGHDGRVTTGANMASPMYGDVHGRARHLLNAPRIARILSALMFSDGVVSRSSVSRASQST